MRSVWPKTCICLITIKRNKREKDTHTHAHTLTPNERTKKNSFSVEHFERRIERRRLKLTKSEIIPFFLLCLCFFYFLAIAHSLTLTIFLSSRLSGGNQIFVNLALSMLETKVFVRICCYGINFGIRSASVHFRFMCYMSIFPKCSDLQH